MNPKLFIILLSLPYFLISTCFAIESQHTSSNEVKARKTTNVAPYFPVIIGNSWKYSCSLEGVHAFDKTLTITGSKIIDGVTYFRGELRVDDDPKALERFYFLDKNGGIHTSFSADSEQSEPLITALPSIGDMIADLVVSSEQKIETPATGKINSLLLQNYSIDDPQISEEKLLIWEGKFYSRGIGLVIEADGSGRECVLVSYSLVDS
ncbi:MAG: hypothetical protein P8179_01425 [Candidatus Thiodiazotropha sp.]|jgi:hypothetical protein